ncbi:hypothetical protein MYSTI_07279 [Myxococcus stipitatus DSM 14675]|uniref:Uncharacterized protein n=1 Tax=Myxococcus stipitatus (strain DSM 14675 / JCM 12634 / Mx s8) TaxID=1278073 RepID=L7UHU3_MYXSD|nr:hypothetical protein [Myxococcus stipitatus]AGC48551.1 hypothetical protein MYSTI_07279 [Myxococcus stipitatus DSM 14675]
MDPVEATVAVLITAMVLGIPLFGLTIRFSLKPVMEAFIRLREAQMGSNSAETARLAARVARLEGILDSHGITEEVRSSLSLSSGAPERVLGSPVKDRERV